MESAPMIDITVKLIMGDKIVGLARGFSVKPKRTKDDYLYKITVPGLKIRNDESYVTVSGFYKGRQIVRSQDFNFAKVADIFPGADYYSLESIELHISENLFSFECPIIVSEIIAQKN